VQRKKSQYLVRKDSEEDTGKIREAGSKDHIHLHLSGDYYPSAFAGES